MLSIAALKIIIIVKLACGILDVIDFWLNIKDVLYWVVFLFFVFFQNEHVMHKQ